MIVINLGNVSETISELIIKYVLANRDEDCAKEGLPVLKGTKLVNDDYM